MKSLNRRQFVSFAAVSLMAPAAFIKTFEQGSALFAARRTMLQALAIFDNAFTQWRATWNASEARGMINQDGFSEWFDAQPTTLAYNAARDRAFEAVEAVFMSDPQTELEEDIVMEALEAYAQIAPSSFALQTARDLFTPIRFQKYPLERLRHWLLTDPEEDFEKTGMPRFLREMRSKQ